MNNENPETRLETALAMIDEANALDPRLERWEDGDHPREWLYGRRMSRWLGRLAPAASETLQIAARAQHMCRWEHPRSSYPEGRAGYLRWRSDLYGFHAEKAAGVMKAVGYDSADIARVRDLLLKGLIRTDPEAAALEDAACLVFLEFHFADFSREQDEAKVVRILQKTWKKMSESGRAAAATISLSSEAKRLMGRALGDL